MPRSLIMPAIDPKPYRIDGRKKVKLAGYPTAIGDLYAGKKDYRKKLGRLRKAIDARQNMMYAHDRYSMLVIFQAMDAAGKDGTIRAVFSGVNPHGLMVSSFKRPSEKELDHNFLWRTTVAMPPRGHIGIFNRSYYEEVLVCRVHPEIVTDYQKLPGEATRDLDDLFKARYEAIRNLERYAADNGTVILKFFLNVSRDEQRRRFLSRIDEQEKNWKFSEGDVHERKYWDDYHEAYARAIAESARPHAPWFAVPADDKKSMRLLVGAAVLEALEAMDLAYPEVSDARREELESYRDKLAGD